jgi:microcystin-dependent protein
MDYTYIGTIKLFAGNYAPKGWHFCHGQQLSIQSYQALFAVIGTQFGGDGRTTFMLPNLQLRVPIGAGKGEGLSQINQAGNVGNATIVPQAQLAKVPVAGDPVVSVNRSENLNNRQPYLALNYIICVVGIFPSRP